MISPRIKDAEKSFWHYIWFSLLKHFDKHKLLVIKVYRVVLFLSWSNETAHINEYSIYPRIGVILFEKVEFDHYFLHEVIIAVFSWTFLCLQNIGYAHINKFSFVDEYVQLT
jgi:hypothetical protein